MGIDFRRYAGCFFVFVFLFFSSNSLYPYDRGIRTDFSDGRDTFSWFVLLFVYSCEQTSIWINRHDSMYWTGPFGAFHLPVRSCVLVSVVCILSVFPFFLSLTLHTSTFAPFAYMYVLAFLDFLFFSSMVFLQVPRVPRG